MFIEWQAQICWTGRCEGWLAWIWLGNCDCASARLFALIFNRSICVVIDLINPSPLTGMLGHPSSQLHKKDSTPSLSLSLCLCLSFSFLSLSFSLPFFLSIFLLSLSVPQDLKLVKAWWLSLSSCLPLSHPVFHKSLLLSLSPSLSRFPYLSLFLSFSLSLSLSPSLSNPLSVYIYLSLSPLRLSFTFELSLCVLLSLFFVSCPVHSEILAQLSFGFLEC